MDSGAAGLFIGGFITFTLCAIFILQPLNYYQYEDCRNHNGNDYCYAKYLKFEENRNDKQ